MIADQENYPASTVIAKAQTTDTTAYPTIIVIKEEKYPRAKKVCNCTADSPCKKDGICRCKLFPCAKEENLETVLNK